MTAVYSLQTEREKVRLKKIIHFFLCEKKSTTRFVQKRTSVYADTKQVSKHNRYCIKINILKRLHENQVNDGVIKAVLTEELSQWVKRGYVNDPVQK